MMMIIESEWVDKELEATTVVDDGNNIIRIFASLESKVEINNYWRHILTECGRNIEMVSG